MYETKTITFAGSVVTLEAQGAEACRVAALLLAQLGPDDAPEQATVASHWTLRLVGDAPGALQVYAGPPDAPLHLMSDNHAVDVVRRLEFHLADRSQGGLLFHAAALSWQGHGLLLPGVSRAGKTTLCAWLVAQGLSYMSDELVYLPDGTMVMQVLRRPLNLRLASLAALQGELATTLAELTPSDGLNTLVAPQSLGAAEVLAQAPLNLIIFPRYAPAQPLSFTQMSKASAALWLMERLVNARNLVQHGFPAVTRLVREVPAYSLVYSDFSQLKPWLAQLKIR